MERVTVWDDRLNADERALLMPGRPPELDRSPDILVVGGGAIGLAAAVFPPGGRHLDADTFARKDVGHKNDVPVREAEGVRTVGDADRLECGQVTDREGAWARRGLRCS